MEREGIRDVEGVEGRWRGRHGAGRKKEHACVHTPAAGPQATGRRPQATGQTANERSTEACAVRRKQMRQEVCSEEGTPA